MAQPAASRAASNVVGPAGVSPSSQVSASSASTASMYAGSCTRSSSSLVAARPCATGPSASQDHREPLLCSRHGQCCEVGCSCASSAVADELHQASACGRLVEPGGETLEAELACRSRARSPVRLVVGELGERRGRVERRDLPVGRERLRLGGEASCCEQRLERAVLVQQRGGRLGADPSSARDAIGGVSAQRDEVHDLRRVDAVALAHLGGADAHHLADTARRLQDRRRRARQLEGVAIRRRHQLSARRDPPPA